MIQKLKKNNAETLIETLVSMLVIVLCMGILNSSILAATNVNKKTRELDETFTADLQRAEGYISESGYEKDTEQKVTIEFPNNPNAFGTGTNKKSIKVTLYGGAKDKNLFATYVMEAPYEEVE